MTLPTLQGSNSSYVSGNFDKSLFNHAYDSLDRSCLSSVSKQQPQNTLLATISTHDN